VPRRYGKTRELPIVRGKDLRHRNPRPDAEVAALDFVSAKADVGPFVVAITVERGGSSPVR
jgi:hypothetical protein